jgi:hypothetical protein
MLKKSIAVVFAVALAMTATVASAQTFCNIAAYADAQGTQSTLDPVEGQTFSVFVVMFTEDTAAAAAYSMTMPSGPTGPFPQARFSGPSGNGLVIDEPTGTNVALGECVIGFGGLPVLIDEYQFVVIPGFAGGHVTIGPNASQDPNFPVYVTCNDLTKTCESGAALVLGAVIDNEASSFSNIKSLYH